MLNMVSSASTISFEGIVPHPESLIRGQQQSWSFLYELSPTPRQPQDTTLDLTETNMKSGQ